MTKPPYNQEKIEMTFSKKSHYEWCFLVIFDDYAFEIGSCMDFFYTFASRNDIFVMRVERIVCPQILVKWLSIYSLREELLPH